MNNIDHDEEQGEPELIVRVRGLPWQATREDILNFFSDCSIKNGINGIHLTLSREGRPSGEAYIEMETKTDYRQGLDCHKKHMGSRYIEVFQAKKSEMDWMIKRRGVTQFNSDPNFDGFVRLRGLPFGSKQEDIEQFFQGLEIVRNGIVLPVDHQGRATGEAYVQFATRDIAEKAMGKHKEKIGHRYIEIFKSSGQEFRAVWNYTYGNSFQNNSNSDHHLSNFSGPYCNPNYNEFLYSQQKMRYNLPFNRPSPYDRNYSYRNQTNFVNCIFARAPPPPGGSRRGSGLWDDYDAFRGRYSRINKYSSYDDHRSSELNHTSRHIIHMRGLPYRANEHDIYEFFRPLQPISVKILYDDLGRVSGEADVEFVSHEDAAKAMNRNKANMQHRYIELFLHSSPSPPPSLSLSSPALNRALPAPVPPPNYNDLNLRYSIHGPNPQPVPPPLSSTSLVNEVSGTGINQAIGNLSVIGGVISNFNNPIQTAIQTAIDHRLGQDDLRKRI